MTGDLADCCRVTSEKLRQGMAFFEDLKRPAGHVLFLDALDPHGVVDRVGNVLGS